MNYELIKENAYGTWQASSMVLDCRRHSTMNRIIRGFGMSKVAITSVSRVVEAWKIFEMHLRWSNTCLKKNQRHITHSA
jgi:hypothetical protein